MNRSESISQLSAALAKAQGEFTPAKKTGENPHLKNTYATLDDVIASVRGPLSANGLAVVQPLTSEGEHFILETLLMHESGEWIGTEALIQHMAGNRGVNELQAFGGALTYMRRYMLSAMLGINTEADTDGEGPRKNGNGKQPAQKQPTPHWVSDEATRKKFWAWAKGTMTLSEDQVHTALGVASVKEFKGTKGDAMTAINEWVAAQAAAEGVGDG